MGKRDRIKGKALALVLLGAAVWVPSALAEREKKPAQGPGNGLKPPAGKPAGEPRAESGAMVRLEGGTFRMGADDLGNAKPVHEVKVASFRMDVTEVTMAAYGACVKAGYCTKPDDINHDRRCNRGKSDQDTHPVNCVDWSQATAFCRWAGKRLPTEEEWEFAARSGSKGDKYPWGDAAPGNQLCWSGEGDDLGRGNRRSTCAVGSYPSGNTSTGLKDMAGNVLEWTSSQWCPYTASGYDVGDCEPERIARGGDWSNTTASDVRVVTRHWMMSVRVYFVGFRCARTD